MRKKTLNIHWWSFLNNDEAENKKFDINALKTLVSINKNAVGDP